MRSWQYYRKKIKKNYDYEAYFSINSIFKDEIEKKINVKNEKKNLSQHG